MFFIVYVQIKFDFKWDFLIYKQNKTEVSEINLAKKKLSFLHGWINVKN